MGLSPREEKSERWFGLLLLLRFIKWMFLFCNGLPDDWMTSLSAAQLNNCVAENAELFVNYLEAMVETCLPIEEGECEGDGSGHDHTQYPSTLSVSSHQNLSSSLSSLTLASPTEKGGALLPDPLSSVGIHPCPSITNLMPSLYGFGESLLPSWL